MRGATNKSMTGTGPLSAQASLPMARQKGRVLTDLTEVTVGRISRADVAAFMLAQLNSDRYLRQIPLLTY